MMAEQHALSQYVKCYNFPNHPGWGKHACIHSFTQRCLLNVTTFQHSARPFEEKKKKELNGTSLLNSDAGSCKTRKQYFQSSKRKVCPTWILYPAKLSISVRGECNCFRQARPRRLISNRCFLRKMWNQKEKEKEFPGWWKKGTLENDTWVNKFNLKQKRDRDPGERKIKKEGRKRKEGRKGRRKERNIISWNVINAQYKRWLFITAWMALGQQILRYRHGPKCYRLFSILESHPWRAASSL